jgi:hypothetical protein
MSTVVAIWISVWLNNNAPLELFILGGDPAFEDAVWVQYFVFSETFLYVGWELLDVALNYHYSLLLSLVDSTDTLMGLLSSCWIYNPLRELLSLCQSKACIVY